MTNGKDWEERENKRGLYHSRSRRIRGVYIRMKTNVSKAEDPSTALDVVHLYHSHPLISEGKNFTLLISDLTAGTNCYLTYIPSNHVPSACMGHSYAIVFVCTSLPKTADKRQACVFLMSTPFLIHYRSHESDGVDCSHCFNYKTYFTRLPACMHQCTCR